MSYYVNDIFFNTIIDEYMSKYTHLKKTENKDDNDIVFYYSSNDSCNKCNIINSIDNNDQIGNKRKLYENIGNKSFMPLTYTFNKNDLSIVKKNLYKKKYWIIKPEYELKQRGVTIIKNYEELIDALNQNKQYKDWIIQEYIDKPLLYKNKKFHFRVYVLLRKFNNKFIVYLYPKGYMYVADNEYNINDINKNNHITSSCNNVEFPNGYNKFFSNNEFQLIIYPQIVNIVRETIQNTHNYYSCKNINNNCYKFIAFDIIPDNNKKLYLMEVNARNVGMSTTDIYNKCTSDSPSLQTMKFKKELMFDILNIIFKNNNKVFNIIFDYNYDNSNYYFKYIIIIIIMILVYIYNIYNY